MSETTIVDAAKAWAKARDGDEMDLANWALEHARFMFIYAEKQGVRIARLKRELADWELAHDREELG